MKGRKELSYLRLSFRYVICEHTLGTDAQPKRVTFWDLYTDQNIKMLKFFKYLREQSLDML
jgi:hypothetical protein